MLKTAPRIIPNYDSTGRPAWLVHRAQEVAFSPGAAGERIEWPQLVVRSCNELLAGDARLRARSRPSDRQAFPSRLTPRTTSSDRGVGMAAELLGGLVSRISYPAKIAEMCRMAYPRRWDEALDEYIAYPGEPQEPDPVLYDHSVSLASARGPEPPWPVGIDGASVAVKNFANITGAYSSHGLSLAHVAPSPVVWPPPDVSPGLTEARLALRQALSSTLVDQEQHTAMVFSCLAARDNPDLPNPTQAEVDEVNASLRDWAQKVLPAARGLATATYAHAWEWASTDPQRWDPSVVNYAYVEAYLSVHDLRQAADAYDLTDAAVRSHAWWWCHDQNLDVAALRDLAATW